MFDRIYRVLLVIFFVAGSVILLSSLIESGSLSVLALPLLLISIPLVVLFFVFFYGPWLMARGNAQAALNHYNFVLRILPGNPSLRASRALLRSSTGDFEGALEDYDAAIEKRSDNIGLLTGRATIYGQIGKYDKALADCNRAIKLNPELPDGYNNRSSIYIAVGEFEQARKDAEMGLRYVQDPVKRVLLLMNRGLARALNDNYLGAVMDIEAAIAIDIPPEAKAQLGERLVALLAIFYRKTGQDDRALELWQSLIQRDSNHREIIWVQWRYRWPPALLAEVKVLLDQIANGHQTT